VALLRQSQGKSAWAAQRTAPFLRLVALSNARLSTLFGMRFARFAGVLLLIGYGVAIVSAGAHGSTRPSVLVVRALGWLSWLVAASAASAAARDLAAFDVRDGVTDLASSRGFAPQALGPARMVAAAFRISSLTGVPALVIGLLALMFARSGAELFHRFLLCGAIAGYALLLGGALGALARWSAALSPAHGRSVLFAVVLLPELIQSTWPSFPSLPSTFARLLEGMRVIGVVS
jgi:small-conductance mechanosensitive channel